MAIVGGLFGLALALRLMVAWLPVIAHPDELWQYLEPAHYLATGRWVRAWEYRDGIRSWLIPLVLSGPMAVGHGIAPGTMAAVLAPRLVCSVTSLGAVWAGYRFGARSGRRHALIAMLVMATWSEAVYYASRTLSEPIGWSLFLPAAWLLLGTDQASRRRIVLGGLLVGLAVCARLQMAPVAGALAILGCRADLRRWGALTAGGAAALALSAGADLLAGQPPLWWMVENIRINLIEHRSAHYGVEPWYWYLTQGARNWGVGTLLIVPLALVGARRRPALLVLALVHLAAHALIPHKEMRFVLPTQLLLVLLAALGSADLLARVPRHLHKRATIGVVAGWLVLSGIAAVSGTSFKAWRMDRPLIETQLAAATDPAVCGLGWFSEKPPAPAGYSFYDRDTPIYSFAGPGAAREAAPWRSAFNVAIASPGMGAHLGPDYRFQGCAPARPGWPVVYCIYRRAGTCPMPAPARYEINAVMARTGH